MAGICLPAQQVEFSARVHAQRIGLDDTLEFTLTLSGVDNPVPPDLSDLTDFDVQSRSQSTEFRMVNGRTSHLTRFEYRLSPQRTGTLTIPAMRYQARGQALVTKPIQVEVVKGSVAPPPSQRSPFGEDLFAFPRERGRDQEPIDVRLVMDVSPRSAVPGQQVMVRIRLLTRNTVRAVNLLTEPSIPGFWQEWFPVPRSSAGRMSEVDGKEYTEYDIRKVALFPNQSGNLTIPPLEFEIILAEDGLSFFSEPRRITRSTTPKTIEVRPLPHEATGLPAGDFQFTVEPLPESVTAHEMVTLKLRISGNGNMKTIGVPQLEAGPFFQTFPPKVNRVLDHSGKWLRGTVSAEIPITFRRAGAVSLPPLELRWWDPAAQQIRVMTSSPMTVKVMENRDAGENEALAAGGAEAVRRGRDIHHIQGEEITDQSNYWNRSRWYTWLLLLPFLLSLATVIYRGIWEPLIRRSRRLETRRVLSRTLKDLQSQKDLGSAAGIIENYLSRRLGMKLSRMNAATIARAMEDRGVTEREIRDFLFLKEKIDSTRFAPRSGEQDDSKDLRRLAEVLRRIDGKIK